MSRTTVTAACTPAFILAGLASAAGAHGLVSTWKLSAAIASELVADSAAICAQKDYAVTAVAPIHTLDNAKVQDRMK